MLFSNVSTDVKFDSYLSDQTSKCKIKEAFRADIQIDFPTMVEMTRKWIRHQVRGDRLYGFEIIDYLTVATKVGFQLIMSEQFWGVTCDRNGPAQPELIYPAQHILLKYP